jgi:type IV pilus assembly protein PilY1
MKLPLILKRILAVALVVAAGYAMAEDIDIYQANNNSSTSNLLVVFDNSASGWSSNATTNCTAYALGDLNSSGGGVQACGMWRAVDQIGNTPSLLGKLNMGIMMLSQPPTNGGTFRFPAVATPAALVNMNAAGITAMKANLQGLVGNDKSSSRDVGGSTWESWAFYAGRLGASGRTYPGIAADTCGKNFVIRVGVADNNANPADQSSNSAGVLAALGTAGASATQQQQINWVNDNKFVGSWGDEWSRFMKQNNAITTYTITLKDTSATDTQNVSSYVRFMKSVADVSGGKAFVVDINDMDAFVQALLAIFNEINAVNSVFASASLPISSNGTGNFLNQVYFGMFRPDAAGLPRWSGNLKQYQFALDLSDPLDLKLFLADSRAPTTATRADGTTYPLYSPALSSAGTGFFDANAVSFWTTKNTAALPDNIDPTGALAVNGGTAGGFFIFNPQGAGDGFDSPDGEVVEKGGVAQRIRLENLTNNYATAAGTATNPRRIYTCTTGTTSCIANSSLSATPFAKSNDGITATLLGAGIPGAAVSSITRNDTTATAFAAMNPIPANGSTVTVTGSVYSQFNGVKIIGSPTATSFTYPVTVIPPVATTGTYTASIPAGNQAIASLIRTGATTVRANFAAAHGYGNGQSVTISGATNSGYNGTYSIALVDATNFDITIPTGNLRPTTPQTAGNATVPAKANLVINNIVRGAPAAAAPFLANVTVTTTAVNNYVVGDTVTITGTSGTPSYNGSFTITNLGNKCTGGSTLKGSPLSFCFNIATAPTNTPDTTAFAGTPAAAATIATAGLTRVATTCTGGAPTPVTTVTATTTAAHGFAVGQVVNISGTIGTDEALYTGNQTILSVPSAISFTYSITTSPACSDSTGGMLASALGVDRDTLIDWVRGHDSFGDEASPTPGGSITVRPSIHGDVLHSRPSVVNYAGTTGVVVFYGSNDGTFRAVNGNQTAAIGTVPAGGELWSFVPTEFYSKLKRAYLNSPVIKLETTPAAILPTPLPKDYFFDGSVGVYQNITTGQVVLYLTARRGGRLIYAIDVTTPSDPKFLWKKSSADAGFEELGQTWSAPRVALVKGYNDGAAPTPNAKPVLIFGAGYDPAEDTEPQPAAAAASRTMGRGIFILDALTGAIVWQAKTGGGSTTCTGTPCLLDMPYPIPSDVTLLDRDTSDGNGYVDRIYVPDLGGNVWRVDLQPTAGTGAGFAPSTWTVTKFASIGGAVGDATKRKIFFPPDVITTPLFDAVLFTTGDREHPTLTQQSVNIINRFYMLKDTYVGNDGGTTPIVDSTSSTANNVPAGLFNASPILPVAASTTPFTPGATFDASSTDFGFYITLLNAVARQQADGSTLYGPEVETGEKGVNAPTSIGGNTFFGTNSPINPAVTGATCQPNLGTARGYSVNFITGELKTVIYDGGGLPPSPISGVVAVDDGTGTGNTINVPFLIGGVAPEPCSGPLCASKPPIPIEALRSRTYWYRDIGNR